MEGTSPSCSIVLGHLCLSRSHRAAHGQGLPPLKFPFVCSDPFQLWPQFRDVTSPTPDAPSRQSKEIREESKGGADAKASDLLPDANRYRYFPQYQFEGPERQEREENGLSSPRFLSQLSSSVFFPIMLFPSEFLATSFHISLLVFCRIDTLCSARGVAWTGGALRRQEEERERDDTPSRRG